nr:Flavin-dependent thymidylate synthase [Ipomoea batatas]
MVGETSNNIYTTHPAQSPTNLKSFKKPQEGRNQKKQKTMNKYAKIKADSNSKSKSKSRSLESSADPKSFSNTTHHSQSPETQEFNEIKKENIISRDSDFDDHQEQQDDSKSGSGFGVKLTRSSSVASSGAPQQRFRLERAGSRRVKKAFSMRRSSSVSERYCRIHNQCVTLSSPTYDDGDMDSNNGDYAGETSPTSAEKISGTVKSTSEKLLRACKRFLRL